MGVSSLNLHHVNYLIWRHLQEQGYGKTAIQLSREWQTPDPQALPFASAVSPFSLIRMLQDGIAFDQHVVNAQDAYNRMCIEQDTARGITGTQDEPEFVKPKRRWDFVDITRPRPISQEGDHRGSDDEQRRPKRPRLDFSSARYRAQKQSNGDVATNGDDMDIDEERDPQRFRSEEPSEDILMQDEPAPLAHTLDTGISTSTQTLETPDKTLINPRLTYSLPGANLYQVQWSNDSTATLTVTGEAAWHSLTVKAEDISEKPVAAAIADHDQPEIEAKEDGIVPAQEGPEPALASKMETEVLVDAAAVSIPPRTGGDVESKALYSSVEFSMIPTYEVLQSARPAGQSDKKCSAHAVEMAISDGMASASLLVSGMPGAKVVELENPVGTVVAIRFNEPANLLAAVSVSGVRESAFEEGEDPGTSSPIESTVRVWDLTNADYMLDAKVPLEIRDAVWTAKGELIVCGHATLAVFSTQDSTTFDAVEFIDSDQSWLQMCYNKDSQLLACSTTDTGSLGLLNLETRELRMHMAHETQITALRWKPSDPASGHSATPVLASADSGGAVKLWNVPSEPDLVRHFSVDDSAPILALEFTPDGNSLAAVTEDALLVWKADAEGNVLAQWRRPAERNGVQRAQSKTNGLVEMSTLPNGTHDGMREGDQKMVNHDDVSEHGSVSADSIHSLAWHMEGKKLAYAVEEKVCQSLPLLYSLIADPSFRFPSLSYLSRAEFLRAASTDTLHAFYCNGRAGAIPHGPLSASNQPSKSGT